MERIADPPASVAYFQIQRGFSKPLIRTLFPAAKRIKAQLLTQSPEPANCPLICTSPYYAPLAEIWPGPVVYYLTDLMVGYVGLNPEHVRSFDRRLCQVARAVCPNSNRIASYLVEQAGCALAKITVVPNATRQESLRTSPSFEPGPLPDDLAGLPRPVAGIIGNLAGNLDWVLLQEAVRRTPWLSWAFVGPASMKISSAAQSQARTTLLSGGPRIRFVGEKPYGVLRDYARAFDVAVLPYAKVEPTFSGSATRFYEHLAAGRPMISTKGVEELLHKEPLLRLTDNVEELVRDLGSLQNTNFRDGYEAARRQASRNGTWERRAATILEAVGSDVPATVTERSFQPELYTAWARRPQS